MPVARFDHEAALEDARVGMSFTEIAAKHGVSRQAISQVMRRNGVEAVNGGQFGTRIHPDDELRPDLDVLIALSHVPAHEREAFVDHYIIGDTLQDIARRLGVGKATVGVRAERARRRLAEHLQHRTAA